MRVDCIVTSANRFDLLDRTLEALFKYNTTNLNNVYIYEDSAMDDDFGEVVTRYPVIPIFGTVNKGQIHALDTLLGLVETEFYLGIEDDTVCCEFGFIPEAIVVMRDREVGCVSGRGRSLHAHNGHGNINGVMDKGWNGFSGWSYAPTLHRLEDYIALGGYGKHTKYEKKQPWLSEKTIGNLILDSRRYCYATEKQYFVHAGSGRSTLNMNL